MGQVAEKLAFKEVDFKNIFARASAVYVYYKSVADYQIDNINELLDHRLCEFADFHSLNIKEIHSVFEIAFNKGIVNQIKEIEHRSKIAIDAVLNYLVSEVTELTFSERFDKSYQLFLLFSPTSLDDCQEWIKEMGFEVGMFYHAWHEILSNAQSFNKALKKEFEYKSEYISSRTPTFPKIGANTTDLPHSMQHAVDFKYNIEQIRVNLERYKLFIPYRNDLTKKENIRIRASLICSGMIYHEDFIKFQELGNSFLRETEDNISCKVFQQYKADYLNLRDELIKCIEALNRFRFKYEIDFKIAIMNSPYGIEWHEKMIKNLTNVKKSFDKKIIDIHNTIGFRFGHESASKEEQLTFLTNIYWSMIEKGNIECKLHDFISVFTARPTILDHPIIWKIEVIHGKYANQPNKEALRDFLEAMICKKLGNEKSKVPHFFNDKNGNPIRIGKPQGGTSYNFKKLISLAK